MGPSGKSTLLTFVGGLKITAHVQGVLLVDGKPCRVNGCKLTSRCGAAR